MAACADAFLQVWDGLQAYACPPFALIRRVLNKLRTCRGTCWPQNEWFLELLCLTVALPVPLPLRRDLLRQLHFHRLHQNLHVLCLHEWRLYNGLLTTSGLSRGVANQLFLCRRQSFYRLYQYHWECYRAWCAARGHSVLSPTVAKIADFLLFLRSEKHLSVSATNGY